VGRRFSRLRRLGKYLLLDLDGELDSIVVHLGMTGRLLVVDPSTPRAPHTHVVWSLGRAELRFVDPRRFGQVKLAPRGRLPELDALGPDPLGPGFTAEALHAMTRVARRGIKDFLLDQSRIAGIGNIYASEALFEAAIDPRIRANRLTRARVETLRKGIVTVLQRGLRNRGTTLRDYVDANGEMGANQHALRVYGREGEKCRRCRGVVRRLPNEARGTFYCPGCQKR
jgi:formamidopyrimidine-DNA glycosylase